MIAISSDHRREALEAVQYCIDELKATVEIWKREHYGCLNQSLGQGLGHSQGHSQGQSQSLGQSKGQGLVSDLNTDLARGACTYVGHVNGGNSSSSSSSSSSSRSSSSINATLAVWKENKESFDRYVSLLLLFFYC